MITVTNVFTGRVTSPYLSGVLLRATESTHNSKQDSLLIKSGNAYSGFYQLSDVRIRAFRAYNDV